METKQLGEREPRELSGFNEEMRVSDGTIWALTDSEA